MRIAINTLTTTANIAGVGNYLINLLEGLQKNVLEDEFLILVSSDNEYMFNIYKKNFKKIKLVIRQEPRIPFRVIYHIWHIFFLSGWCKRNKVDLLHLPNTMFVPPNVKTITTIHDIAESKIKKYGYFRSLIRGLMVRDALKKSAVIIAISNYTKNDLIKIRRRKINTIYNGFNDKIFKNKHINKSEVLSKYQLIENEYIIYVGGFHRHKNVPKLIISYERYLELNNRKLKLLLLGKYGPDLIVCKRLIYKKNLLNNVQILNYVPENEKVILIQQARFLCLLSEYEGFGYPILEGQAAGIPIVLANKTKQQEFFMI